ncbi:MAG TPA: inorganic phosphate transporter [Thermoanaerobaculia bacterium]|nr:inorganic phosphate transporter [Thermoanaerobaculia bacterium]
MALTAAAGLALLAVLLAFGNGANDVSKGIATLVGSGVSDLRAAVAWGAAWTVAGGLIAAVATQGLVAAFSGAGFLGHPLSGSAFLASVAAGAIAWVIFASATGLPVSTTHAIAGALAGAGVAAEGARALHWSFLANRIALPLAISPVASVALLYAVFPLLGRALARLDRYCVCVERRVAIEPSGAAAFSTGAAVVAEVEECAAAPSIAGRLGALDGLHWMLAACTSLARGVNDTPKILALGVAAAAVWGIRGPAYYAAVAAGMGAGSVIAGRRVTETLARKVTAMTAAEGFSANLVTTLLVGAASFAALPVSTTHVSSGAVIGIGLRRGRGAVRWKTVRDIVLAWIVTLPVAALAGAAAWKLLASR